MRLQNRISFAKVARYTLVSGVLGEFQETGSHRAVAEYEILTFPRMLVRHFNIERASSCTMFSCI
jgi:hypothetical protein